MERILILKHGALGDVIRTTYIAESLKAKYPSSRIEWVTRDTAVDLIRFNPFIDRVIGVTKTGDFRAGEQLESQSYDWVISLDDEKESCRLATSVQAGKISGAYISSERVVPTDDVLPWFGMGLISPYGKAEADAAKVRNCLSHAEIFRRMLGLDFIRPSFYNDPTIEERFRTQFSTDVFHVGLNLSAGKRWASKSLRVAEAIDLVKKLTALNSTRKLRVHLLGGEDDLDYNRSVLSGLSMPSGIDLVPPCSLLEFAATIKSMNAIVCSDTMALHLAIAQGIPSVSYYAPTSAAEIDTFGTGRKVLSTAADYCSYRPDADNSSITAGKVWAELIQLPGFSSLLD